MFSVCATLYGAYPQLARRLLNSLENHAFVQDFRLGLNAVCDETRAVVVAWALQQMHRCPVYLYEEDMGINLGKYPLMRQMLRDRSPADKIMWFDDDSYLDPAAGANWWRKVAERSHGLTQLGVPHYIPQRGRQHEVIPLQPWYNHKPVDARHRYRFATGGWWVADTAFLLRWNYPFPALYHNGGDSILGELIRQQGSSVAAFPEGTQCHCESCAMRGLQTGIPVVHVNVGGRNGRRGIGGQNERYVWADGNPKPSLVHQDFDLRIHRYEVSFQHT